MGKGKNPVNWEQKNFATPRQKKPKPFLKNIRPFLNEASQNFNETSRNFNKALTFFQDLGLLFITP